MLMLAVNDDVSFDTVVLQELKNFLMEMPSWPGRSWNKSMPRSPQLKKSDLKAEFLKTKLPSATSDPDAWFTKLELIIAKLKIDY